MLGVAPLDTDSAAINQRLSVGGGNTGGALCLVCVLEPAVADSWGPVATRAFGARGQLERVTDPVLGRTVNGALCTTFRDKCHESTSPEAERARVPSEPQGEGGLASNSQGPPSPCTQATAPVPTSTVMVSGVLPFTSEAELMDLFSSFGVVHVRLRLAPPAMSDSETPERCRGSREQCGARDLPECV